MVFEIVSVLNLYDIGWFTFINFFISLAQLENDGILLTDSKMSFKMKPFLIFTNETSSNAT